MTYALVLGSLLGLFSGVAPGAFSGLVAATALHRGFRAGLLIAAIPLLSEVVVLAVTAVLVSRVPPDALRWMGLCGGILILHLAWRTFRESADPPSTDPAQDSARRTSESVGLALLSPAPWVFWLLVGSPLFLSAWREGWPAGLVFVGAYLFFMVGANVGWAGLAAYGQRRLDDAWTRRLMLAAAAVLAVAGSVLIWQSWIGNFQQMVSGSEAIGESVEDRVR
jgi:threonine/homoserine/homoserine lactone efflux protein